MKIERATVSERLYLMDWTSFEHYPFNRHRLDIDAHREIRRSVAATATFLLFVATAASVYTWMHTTTGAEPTPDWPANAL
jgi:hypothetical protein